MHKIKYMMSIKAVFFDIDGTLVSFNTHKIPLSAIEAINTIHKNGIKVFIATGRPVAIINNLNEIKDIIDGYITFNGAYCFIGNKDISISPIPKQDVNVMLEDSTKRDYAVLVCGKNDVAVYNHKPIFDELFVKGLGVTNVNVHKPIEPILKDPILQLTPFFTKEKEKDILPKMYNSVSARWHPEFTDITINGANKGEALHKMAKALNIDVSECMVFGDGGNDKGIIEAAGIGIAMGNAEDSVKSIANYVTTSVDNYGIKNGLKNFGLI